VKLIAKDILASASLDATIKIWNTTDGTLLRTLACHLNQIFNSLDLMSDGQTLVSGSMDTTLKFWNYETGGLLNTINSAFSAINSLAVVNTSIQQSKN
jgi:WD40 repeat protein